MAAGGKGARTRRRILMSAAEVIATRGVTQTSLADVVSAANVSKGALYFHFSSKEELLVAVEELYNADSRRMIEQVRQDPDPLRRLIRLSLALARRQYRDRLANAHDRLMLSRALPAPTGEPGVDWAALVRAWLDEAVGPTVGSHQLLTVAELFDDCLVGVVTATHVVQRSTSMIARMAGLWRWLALPGLVPEPGRRAAMIRFVDELQAWSEADLLRPLDEDDDALLEPSAAQIAGAVHDLAGLGL